MKICKDCKYYRNREEDLLLDSTCRHPTLGEVNLVSGYVKYPTCKVTRSYAGQCKPEALLFEEKPVKRTFADKISNYFHCGRYE